MIKLILKENRIELKREYVLRFVVSLIIFMSTALIIFGISLLASYFNVVVHKKIIFDELDKIRNSETTKNRKQVDEISKRINEKLMFLDEDIFNPSVLISEINKFQTSGINLSAIEINIKNEESKIADINLKGVAKTRKELLDFQNNLKSSAFFEIVDLPFSILTKEKDITFSAHILSGNLNQIENEK
jgi:hypothetical protein